MGWQKAGGISIRRAAGAKLLTHGKADNSYELSGCPWAADGRLPPISFGRRSPDCRTRPYQGKEAFEMKSLKAKLGKQGGFTLIEMLIVVAIIAILIAVSIPVVNGALERSREATDAANERSFKAALLVSSTVGKFDTKDGKSTDFKDGTVYAYDAANGLITNQTVGKKDKGYGKSTAYKGADEKVRKGQILYGKFDSDSGQVLMMWDAAGKTPKNVAVADNNTLIYPLLVTEE